MLHGQRLVLLPLWFGVALQHGNSAHSPVQPIRQQSAYCIYVLHEELTARAEVILLIRSISAGDYTVG